MLSFHLYLGLADCFFRSGFLTKFMFDTLEVHFSLYSFLIFPMCATHSAHPILPLLTSTPFCELQDMTILFL